MVPGMSRPAPQAFEIGGQPIGNGPLFFLAGPCVLQSRQLALDIAGTLRDLMAERGLEVVDVLQIPAFLCRQTDLLVAAAQTGKPVNVKKGQFLAPWDMANVVKKVTDSGGEAVMVTERGTSFGYGRLVVDMAGLRDMGETGHPVIFDATHSVQRPGALGDRTGGDRTLVPLLARAAVATGEVHGLFLETHPDPDSSPSDGPNMVLLDHMPAVLDELMAVDAAV